MKLLCSALKLVAWIVVSVGLIEIMAAQEFPEPDAQIWAAVGGKWGGRDRQCSILAGWSDARDGRLELPSRLSGTSRQAGGANGSRNALTESGLSPSPDGLILVGGTLDSTIIVWDLKGLQVRAELRRTLPACQRRRILP